MKRRDEPRGIAVEELTVEQIQRGFAEGIYTSEQLTQAFLDRIALHDPFYNIFIALNPAALDEARALDKRRAAGETLGPLAGVPAVVKDSMDMAGMATTSGWSVFSSVAGGVDIFPERDAPVVAKLRAAGAIIIGKVNLSALSKSGTDANTSFVGPVFNPANRNIAPGGSSAGSAAAVAANFAVIALGEETGGSIQNPAGAQSVVAVKPTFGLVANTGVQPACTSLQDVMGPFARTVRDTALALDAIAGHALDDPKTMAAVGRIPAGGYAAGLSKTALRGARIGLYGPGWGPAMSDETQALYDRTAAALAARSAALVEDPFAGSGFADLRENRPANTTPRVTLVRDFQAYFDRLGPNPAIRSFDELRALPRKLGLGNAPYLGEGGDLVGKGGVLEPKPDETVYMETLKAPRIVPDVSAYISCRERLLDTFREVMARERLDALLFPQVLEKYPPIFSKGEIKAAVGWIFSVANLPGVVVPAGLYDGDVPFSVIFVGDLFTEEKLLGYAYDYEQATRLRVVPALATERHPLHEEFRSSSEKAIQPPR